ncbi:MAG: peptidase M20 [Rhodopirellula sp.]|nr:peptidase M20 [Rhodopirellula sp.]
MQSQLKSFEELHSALAEFIAIQSVAGNSRENKRAVYFVASRLQELGFDVRIKGGELLEQPVIVAKRPSTNSERKVVLYGHYDVAEPGDPDFWASGTPYVLQSRGGRLYGRGVADNKGTLLTRIMALRGLIRAGESLPEMLFLIQGKEEVNVPCPETLDIFRREVAHYEADLFVDETGFNDLDDGSAIMFLWSKRGKPVKDSVESDYLAMAGLDRIEWRHLNKLNGGENCPFLNALPEDALYVGFGPNDRLHKIHRPNESLSQTLLEKHFSDFYRFMSAYAQQ